MEGTEEAGATKMTENLFRKDPLLGNFSTRLQWHILLILVSLPLFSAMLTHSLRKATATNPMGAPFLSPQDLDQVLSLAFSCWDHANAQGMERSAQPPLLFLDKESLQQFFLFCCYKKYVPFSSCLFRKNRECKRRCAFFQI